MLFYEVRAPVSPTYITVPLVPPSYYAAAYDSSGLKDDAADGMIVVHAADCEDNALSGVSLRLAPASAEVVTWYGMGVDTVRSNSPDGIGGFTSIEPGRYEVTVLGPGAGEADVIARAAVWVRGGVRTMLWTRPLASTDQ